MVKYTFQRIFLALCTTFIILTLTFFLMKLLPFYPAIGTNETKFAYFLDQTNHVGTVLDFDHAVQGLGDPLWVYTDTSSLTHYFYLKPAGDLYAIWLKGIFTKWNWGASIYILPNVDSMVLIMGYLPTTIKVNVWSVLISVPLGIALGIWAALKKNTMTDHIISTLVMIFISLPSFIVITFLMLIFCYSNQILPSQWPSLNADPLTQFEGYIIPTLSLSFGSICGYCRFTRAELTEVMSSDFLLLARTKGLTKTQTITRHALKNAMVPILPSILAEVIGLLGGSMILEELYGIPGVGKLYITAIQQQDYNVLMADMSLYTIIGLMSGVFLDLSYGFIDPRIRMGAKK
jgi:oligopeptide transport system permease protein